MNGAEADKPHGVIEQEVDHNSYSRLSLRPHNCKMIRSVLSGRPNFDIGFLFHLLYFLFSRVFMYVHACSGENRNAYQTTFSPLGPLKSLYILYKSLWLAITRLAN